MRGRCSALVCNSCNSTRWWENPVRLLSRTFAAHTGRRGVLFPILLLFSVCSQSLRPSTMLKSMLFDQSVMPGTFLFFVLTILKSRKRRGTVTTTKPHQYWCVYDYEGTLKQFNNLSTRMLRTKSTQRKVSASHPFGQSTVALVHRGEDSSKAPHLFATKSLLDCCQSALAFQWSSHSSSCSLSSNVQCPLFFFV